MGLYRVKMIEKNGKQYYLIIRNSDGVICKEAAEYLKYRTDTNSSPNTIKKIAQSITYYLTFLAAHNLSIKNVLAMTFYEQDLHFSCYLQWLLDKKHCTEGKKPCAETCNSYLLLVFGFYKYLENLSPGAKLKVLEPHTMRIKGPYGVRSNRIVTSYEGYLRKEKHLEKTASVTREQIEKALLNVGKNCRNRLILLMLSETGFRVGELLGIRFAEDIDYDRKRVKVEYRLNEENYARAKNAETRWAVLRDKTFDLLMKYISDNGKLLLESGYLFVVEKGETAGKPLKVSAVYSIFRNIEKRTGMHLTPHMFRHFFANERRKAGWSIDMISRALGHRSINITKRYLDWDPDEEYALMESIYKSYEDDFDIDSLI